MDVIHVGLRLIHIIAAFAWVGMGATLAFFVVPAVLRSGESGLRFLKALLTTTPFSRIIPMVAGITMLAGLLLYGVSNSWSYFSSTGNMVLGIGAAAGIIAGIHGGAVTGRQTTVLANALVEHVPDGAKSIPEAALPTLRQHIQKLSFDANVSFVLMAIALIGMGTARYL